ncbi:MAG: heme exporter protein CcmD [Pseudomonadales bacterium]|nr:heme exporter protein CcmD [Pseudomonadales bacterium]
MQFSTWIEFIEMGGHGLYVWLSFAIAIGVISINVLQPWMSQKKLIESLQRKFQRESKLK